jgi:hypothetical protein
VEEEAAHVGEESVRHSPILIQQIGHKLVVNHEYTQTVTDFLADVHSPTAIINRNSGPSNPMHARSSLSLKRAQLPSVLAGILGQTEVQQQRTIVSVQDVRMFKVPRPLGLVVQPCVELLS